MLMFHGNLVHGSAPNITPYPRRIVYLTLCAVSNYIRTPTRPEWIAHRDFSPIEPVADERAARLRASLQGGRGMSLHRLAASSAPRKPVRVGLIGAGKFGSMFLNQSRPCRMSRSRSSPISTRAGARGLPYVGWDARADRNDPRSSRRRGGVRGPEVEIVVEATGSPPAGIAHARAAIAAGKHVVMVNVEADALAGPLLAEEARASGVVYSLAYGDQPALICELVDWARACGFAVVAAGKGTKYLPAYHASRLTMSGAITADAEEARGGGMNPQMFNSFLDGTKSAIEMAAIANATGLDVPHDGLLSRPAGSTICRSAAPARRAARWSGTDGRGGVVAGARRAAGVPRPALGRLCRVQGAQRLCRARFREYGLKTDASGWYAAMYKPYHLIGLELGISVLSAALRGEPTGQAQGLRGDVVAVAKRGLRAGETLDGEGGYTVWGKLHTGRAQPGRGALPSGSRTESR